MKIITAMDYGTNLNLLYKNIFHLIFAIFMRERMIENIFLQISERIYRIIYLKEVFA